MKRFVVFFLLVLTAPTLVMAQPGYNATQRGEMPRKWESNVLTIFSENGDLFFVVINGIRQNINPQSSLRIEGVTQPVNEVQILFADNATREIQKRVSISNPIDEHPVNLTLRIIRERDGDAKLRFFSMVKKERDYVPAQGEYVMFFGQDIDRSVRQGMDRDRDRDRGYDRDRDQDRQVVVVNTPPPPPPPPAGPSAMDMNTFSAAKQTIKGIFPNDAKLSTAKMIANTNYFTTNQVVELCRLFDFEDSRLEFAKYVFKKTIDNNNYFMVNGVFNFPSSIDDLNNFVMQNR